MNKGPEWGPWHRGVESRNARRNHGSDWTSVAWNWGTGCSSVTQDPNPKFAKCWGGRSKGHR